jgi:hypothetical protein
MKIIYNKKYNRYDLPLNLDFSVKNNHIEYPKNWIIMSNIPDLNYKVIGFIEENKETIVNRVINLLKTEFGISDVDVLLEEF